MAEPAQWYLRRFLTPVDESVPEPEPVVDEGKDDDGESAE